MPHNTTLPYLRKMAKGGDADALGCLRKMAEDGDDDAAEALNDIAGEDGNGASPQDSLFGKSDEFATEGDLFEVDELNKAMDDVQEFAEDDSAPEAPAAGDLFEDDPAIQHAVHLDAGDFVKSMVDGTVTALDSLGNGQAWMGTALEALAKAVVANAEATNAIADSFRTLADGQAEMAKSMDARGAGLSGASNTTQMAARTRLAKAAPRGFEAQQQGGHMSKADLRLTLTNIKDAQDPQSQLARDCRDALELMTINNFDQAKRIAAAN